MQDIEDDWSLSQVKLQLCLSGAQQRDLLAEFGLLDKELAGRYHLTVTDVWAIYLTDVTHEV